MSSPRELKKQETERQRRQSFFANANSQKIKVEQTSEASEAQIRISKIP